MNAIHISISAETVFHIGPFAITNSILSSWIVSIIIILVSLWANSNIRRTKKPTGLQNFLEMVVEGLHNFTQGITESSHKTKVFFPFVLSFFTFIILNNWFGLIPGVGSIGFRENAESTETYGLTKPVFASSEPTEETHQEQVTSANPQQQEPSSKSSHESKFIPYLRAGTADVNTTLALAIISCVSTWTLGIKFLGLNYFSRFKNPLELISEISRLISFTFRLFGNVFAGEVLLVVMTALVPVIVPSIFYGMELFFGLIQAFVFSILTLVFMNLATEAHGGSDHKAHA